MCRTLSTFAGLALAIMAPAVAAQSLPARWVAPATPAITTPAPVLWRNQHRDDATGAIAGAVLGGALGAYAGMQIGLAAGESRCRSDASTNWFCGLGEMVLGFMIGETVGVATGAHLGNGRRGNWGANMGIAALSAVAGTFVIAAGDGGAGGLLFLVGALQVGATVAVERRSRR